jgi:CCR4-NOT transcription complex subunit 2
VDQQEDQRAQQASSDQSNGGGDEFPPLGVRTNGEAFEQANGLGGVTLRSPEDSQTQGGGQQTQLPFRETSNASTQAQQAPIGHPLTQTTSQQQQPQSILAAPVQPAAPSGGVKRYADMTEQEQWGLEALSAAYEARKNLESGQPVDETLPPIMRSAIFFGQDLSALGMDLDSLDPIYPTFTPFPAANSTGSTFDFHDRHTIPDFQLPGAYTVNNVPPLAGRVAALSDGNESPASY